MLIKIDFRDTIKKTERIKEYSSEMDRCCNKLDVIMSSIVLDWSGDSANEYIKKLNKVRSKISKHSKKLYKASDGLQRSARVLQQIEEYSVNLFKR